ncbi:MAG: DUF853 family protein [Methylobacterium sp.]|uniref:helicase HerA-like domain-containing protein n=1 Tax=Methylobacterium sp. TaxID=409 RepID=UPI0025F8A3D6|nr:helicase HerA-like domain-containing protein [Methylobacterium sp.]MBX9934872.1 DUF853 family protein [Methylobacterium sp.]
MNGSDPTFLGSVVEVSGASVTITLTESLASGLAIISGHTYRVGQVGSFVRIPQGYQDLYGIVSAIGATPTPEHDLEAANSGRWMRVELVGEAIGTRFERGISQHPSIDDAVHIVTETDLHRIYGYGGDDQVPVGTLSSAENIVVRLSLDNLVTRHSAILGSTGAGKSTTVASLLRSIVRPTSGGNGSPAARILLLDIHGEYTSALSDIAQVFSATPSLGQHPLFVPYWALEAGELLAFVAGDLNETQETAFADKLQDMKAQRIALSPLAGLDPESLTIDSPVPFSLKKLWFDLIDFETATFVGAQRDQPALDSAGNAETLTPPRYRPHAMGASGPFLNPAARGIRRHLNLLRSRLLDRRYDFILHPGPWEPNLSGEVDKDLDSLLQGWLGHDRQITILDLSGIPSSVLVRLIGSILRIIYEALFWSREKTEGGVLRPLLVVMEEAHRYLATDSNNVAADIVKRIAKEGRKYGVGAMLVSQRPAEVDETVLSQCGTVVALRLSNPADRARVIPHANAKKEFIQGKFFNQEHNIRLRKIGTTPWQPLSYPSHGLFTVVSDTFYSCRIVPDRDRMNWQIDQVIRNRADTISEVLGPAVDASVYVFRAERRVPANAQMQESLELSTDGSNLPSVLHYLYTSNHAQFQRYLKLVQRVLPEVEAITLPPAKGEAIIKIWSSGYAQERSDLAIPLDQCGTGIGQVLAILFVLVTAKSSRIIVIDEPNSFLHPGASRVLMQVLRSFEMHQFIITTHSPAVIGATEADTMIVVRWEEGASKTTTYAGDTLNGIRAAFDELGVHISDVFGYDAIIWVEGKTEERCFPLLLKAAGKELPARTAFVSVVNTGDLDRKNAELVWKIYRRLSTQSAFAPPAIAISLDTELRSAEFRAELIKQSNCLVKFLPRRTFENYLLHAEAIAAVLGAEAKTPTVSTADVQKWISDHRSDAKYYRGVSQTDADDWKINVDAPKLLHDLVKELTNATHDYSSRKAHFSFALTSWLVANDAAFLAEAVDYVVGLLRAEVAG